MTTLPTFKGLATVHVPLWLPHTAGGQGRQKACKAPPTLPARPAPLCHADPAACHEGRAPPALLLPVLARVCPPSVWPFCTLCPIVLSPLQNVCPEWAGCIIWLGLLGGRTCLWSPDLWHSSTVTSLRRRLPFLGSMWRTQGGQEHKVLQHHLMVQEPLRLIQEVPLLLGELYGHVLKDHRAL